MYTFANHKPEKMNYRKEHIIYTSMWILLYVSPVMSLYMRMSNNPHIDFSWHEIFNAWIFITVWLVTFAIHNFLLVPLLIEKRRTWSYLACVFALLTAGMVVLYANRPNHKHCEQAEKNAMVRPGEDADSVAFARMARIRLGDGRFCRPEHAHRPPEIQPIDPMPLLGPGELVAVFGGLLLMGMNVGVKLYFKSAKDREKQEQMAKLSLERQMEYLKYQVNPHFFMNTLNNIHALVDIDPERAKTTIVELSKMMRYILYEGNNKLIPLQREIQFLGNYVQLMRLRYTDRVKIVVNVPGNIPDKAIPPLLLIIFVENAFKHGVSYRTDSFIEIDIETHDNRLVFCCRNSKPTQPAANEKKGGMGLQNVRQRLDLLFHDDYRLDINENDKEYDARLEIPLSDNSI